MDMSDSATCDQSTRSVPAPPLGEESGEAGDIILNVCLDIFGGDLLRLAELAAVLGHDAQLLARVEQALGQLAMVCREVAVQQSLVSALDDEAGDVHLCDGRRRLFGLWTSK